MPLSTEEAEQLIAEIKSKIFHPDLMDDYVYDVNCLAVKVSDIEKIINRFANKPPYVTEITFSFSEPLKLILYQDCNHTKEASLAIIHQDKRDAIGIDKQELQMLRDNCTKMLEYLKGD